MDKIWSYEFKNEVANLKRKERDIYFMLFNKCKTSVMQFKFFFFIGKFNFKIEMKY